MDTDVSLEELAEAIHQARKHSGTAEHAVQWDRIMANRVLAYLRGEPTPKRTPPARKAA